MAADCFPKGVSLYDAVTQATHVKAFGGIGLYIAPGGGGWIHLDTRTENQARWGEFVLGKKSRKITYPKALELAREIAQEKGAIVNHGA
jgi:hypothetical protein